MDELNWNAIRRDAQGADVAEILERLREAVEEELDSGNDE